MVGDGGRVEGGDVCFFVERVRLEVGKFQELALRLEGLRRGSWLGSKRMRACPAFEPRLSHHAVTRRVTGAVVLRHGLFSLPRLSARLLRLPRSSPASRPSSSAPAAARSAWEHIKTSTASSRSEGPIRDPAISGARGGRVSMPESAGS